MNSAPDLAETKISVPRYYPADMRAKAKSLYLVKGLQPRDIATQLGVEPATISQWAFKLGWAQLRQRRLVELEKAAEGKTLAEGDEFMEIVAVESEEIALAGFQKARESTQSDSETAAKDFASWTSGVKNLVGMYRTAKGLDTQAGTAQITFNAFYSPTAPKEKQADSGESIDVATTSAD